MDKKKFINFRNYTHFSNFESIIKINKLVEFCIQNELPAVTMCDYMNLFGAAEFSSICLKNKIKPIIGCILNVDNIGEIPVFIYNEQGYKNVSFLLTQTYMNNNTYIDLDELIAYKEGLIILTGDKSIFNTINNVNAENILQTLHNEFKENMFIEINMTNSINISQNMQWSQQYNIPIIVTHTTRFLYESDSIAMQVFKLIKTNDFYDAESDFEWKNMYYHMYQDITEELQIGIENAYNLAKKCCFVITAQEPIIPRYDLKNDINASKLLYEMAINGLQKKIGNIPQNYHDRLNFELKVLTDKNFCEYFLVTADFTKYAHDNNILIGVGRGSGAGCLIAYALNITLIDPIIHGLLFERFLNPARMSLPDFDIDFEPERRHEVIDYLEKKYGKYGVAHIITYIVLQARAVIRDICRVCRVPFREVIHITSLIPQDQINPVRLKEALELVPQLKNLYNDSDRYKFIFNIALTLEGLVRNFSKHAAGVIISHIPIYEKCPLYRDSKGDIVTQYDLKYLEHVGLIKFDFLGLKTLTCLNNAVKYIYTNHNIQINLNNLKLDDAKVFKILNTPYLGKLALEGIFQFEGNALNTIMIKLKATRFNDLVALNALYRPGPIDNIPSYINRKHGKEKIIYLHEELNNKFYNDLHAILEATYGILVYQEQIMQVVCILANFTMADADLLRRAMGKKKHDEMMANKQKFCDGCEKNGIPLYISESIFDTIEKFSGYAFNKSHSAAYSVIAYHCLYLKTHYLAEFTKSYLALESGDPLRINKYLYEMRNRGYSIKKPNMKYEYCEIDGKNVYLGIMEIRNTNIKLANNITLNQPYKNIYDFIIKNKEYLNKKNWESMVYAGMFDDLSIHEEIDHKIYNKYFKRHILAHNFILISNLQMITLDIETMNFEQVLDLNIKAYTITPELYSVIFKQLFKQLNIVSLSQCVNKTKYTVCCVILSLKRKRKGAKVYAFIEIGDETTMCDFALFDTILEKYDSILEEGRQLIFEIEIKNKIHIHNIYTLNDFLRLKNNISIKSNSIDHTKKIIDNIRICEQGNTNISIIYNEEIINTNLKINLTLNNLYNILFNYSIYIN